MVPTLIRFFLYFRCKLSRVVCKKYQENKKKLDWKEKYNKCFSFFFCGGCCEESRENSSDTQSGRQQSQARGRRACAGLEESVSIRMRFVRPLVTWLEVHHSHLFMNNTTPPPPPAWTETHRFTTRTDSHTRTVHIRKTSLKKWLCFHLFNGKDDISD